MTDEHQASDAPIATTEPTATNEPTVRTWSVAGYLVAASAVLGLVVGGLWRVVAPTPELVIRGTGVGYVRLTDSGVGMDLTFGLLGMAAGIGVAIGALLAFRRAGLFAAVGVIVGGLVGSIIAWRFGMFLDPGANEYGPELAQGRADNEVFSGPIVLSAFGVLGLWSLAGAATLAIGFGLRARRSRIAFETVQTQAMRTTPKDA